MAYLDPSGRTPGAGLPARPTAGWQSRLRLRLALRAGTTRVIERTHRGPLVVQRPFHPEGASICHVYLVHPPGGLVGGDRSTVRIDLTDAGHGLITTPAATKIYRSNGPTVLLDQRLTVSDGATLEWLPQGSILFDGGACEMKTVVVLEQGARFIGWDILCLGRPASGERFERGRLVQRLEVHHEGEPLLMEQLRIHGSGPELDAPWGLAGHTTSATFLAVGADGISPALLDAVREVLRSVSLLASATLVSGALVVRVLGDGVHEVQAALVDVWRIVRPLIVGRAATAPRIWAT